MSGETAKKTVTVLLTVVSPNGEHIDAMVQVEAWKLGGQEHHEKVHADVRDKLTDALAQLTTFPRRYDMVGGS